ncbi:hypothetical protein SLE2022_117530 [Rubroshorea leprosula]
MDVNRASTECIRPHITLICGLKDDQYSNLQIKSGTADYVQVCQEFRIFQLLINRRVNCTARNWSKNRGIANLRFLGPAPISSYSYHLIMDGGGESMGN